MKKFLHLLPVFLLLGNWGFAQNNIQLHIHHKLGTADFALNTPAKNNKDNDFKLTRLEYYLSEISLLHDGGTETTIEDLWVLVNANETTSIDLGDHNITNVEAIRFHVGVDPDHNHEDPAAWPNDHPLALQNPSMHWGWASGYRFLALEGSCTASFNQLLQLHCLGDDNYFQTEIALAATAQNNTIHINLDGDYTRILEDINVISEMIIHGDFEETQHALANMRDFVFSPSAFVNSVPDFSEVHHFAIYPNPSSNGTSTMEISSNENNLYNITITNLLGQKVQELNDVTSNERVNLTMTTPGIYLVSLVKDGHAVMTKLLTVNY
jgi:Secretion system C-terminal sorting domain